MAEQGSPRPPFTGVRRSRPWITQARHSWEIDTTRSRLTQVRHPREKPTCRPQLSQVRRPRGKPTHRSRLYQARRWLKPTGRQQVLVDPVHTLRPGVPSHVPWVMVFKSCCAHRNILFIMSCRSCPLRLVGGRRILLCWLRRPFPAACPSCRWSRGSFWGTLGGPLTPRHAQRKPQHPSSTLGGLPVPVGCPVRFV